MHLDIQATSVLIPVPKINLDSIVPRHVVAKTMQNVIFQVVFVSVRMDGWVLIVGNVCAHHTSTEKIVQKHVNVMRKTQKCM